MLQNVRGTTFTVSELLRKNQQGINVVCLLMSDKRGMFVGLTHLVIVYFIRCYKAEGLEGQDFETTPQTHHLYSTLK